MKKVLMIERSKNETNINVNMVCREIEEALDNMYNEYAKQEDNEWRDDEVIGILEGVLRYLDKWRTRNGQNGRRVESKFL